MMLRYIPDFILQQYEKQQLAGSFSGYALFFDIADFTPIGTQLQKHGKEGAEELSRFLDFVFGEPIRIVEGYGGFVSLFAGDAFCAIFPETSGLGILAAVNAIQEFFKDKESYHTPLGDFALKVRITASYGEINWQVYDNPIQSEYVFYGEPFIEMAKLSSRKEDCIFSVEAASQHGLEHFEAMDSGYHPISKRMLVESISISYPHSSEAYNHFIQQRLREQKPDNEIRSAAFCFASLEAIPNEKRNEAIDKLASLSQNYGAYINKLDATDKGLTALILFGLPRSEGKTLERICSFALEAVETLPLLALGISCGSVFAGYTGRGEISEYTAYGYPLNLAARLMSKAIAGEVLTDTYLWLELHAAYDFGYLGSLGLKGIDNPVRYYRLKRKAHGKREENRFVGRNTELNSIRETIDNALNAKENIVLYVSGDAGIGKSRLVSEAMAVFGVENPNSPQPNRTSASQCLLYFITCDAVIRKPLEAIKQMLRSQFYYNPALPMEAAIPMYRALWSTISPGDSEMQRIESFLASLLGYEWQGSIWSMLPPEEKPEQLKSAFVYFIKKLCQSKAILIHLDDGQWLDEESQSYFQALSEAEISPVIFVSPCRYLEDGSKADLQLSKYRRIDWELDSLGEKGCLELTKSIMRLNEIPSATLELISNRSMGNPLFIEQLSSYLMETGSLNAKGEIVKELGYLSSFSISDIVSSRIDRLTDKVKECLFGASVLGMEFDIRVLSEMLKTDLTKELEAGTQSRIWKDLDELRYIFSHILIKDIVCQQMIRSKLIYLHKIASESYLEIYNDTIGEVVLDVLYHLEQSEQWCKLVGVVVNLENERMHYSLYNQCIEKAYEITIRHQIDNIDARCKVLNATALLRSENGRHDYGLDLFKTALDLRSKYLENNDARQKYFSELVNFANYVLVTYGAKAAEIPLQEAEAYMFNNRDIVMLHNVSYLGTQYDWGGMIDKSLRVAEFLYEVSTERDETLYRFISICKLIAHGKDENGVLQKELMEIWKSSQDNEEIRDGLTYRMGMYYASQNNIELAITTLEEAYHSKLKKGENPQYIMRMIAYQYVRLKDYKRAVDSLLIVLDLIERFIGKSRYYYFVLVQLSQYQRLLGDITSAKITINECVDNIILYPPVNKQDVYLTAARIAKDLQDYEQAWIYLDDLVRLNEDGIEVDEIDQIRMELLEVETKLKELKSIH